MVQTHNLRVTYTTYKLQLYLALADYVIEDKMFQTEKMVCKLDIMPISLYSIACLV